MIKRIWRGFEASLHTNQSRNPKIDFESAKRQESILDNTKDFQKNELTRATVLFIALK